MLGHMAAGIQAQSGSLRIQEILPPLFTCSLYISPLHIPQKRGYILLFEGIRNSKIYSPNSKFIISYFFRPVKDCTGTALSGPAENCNLAGRVQRGPNRYIPATAARIFSMVPFTDFFGTAPTMPLRSRSFPPTEPTPI